MLFTFALASTTILVLSTLLLLLVGRHVKIASRILGVVLAAAVCSGGAWAAARLWALPMDLAWIAAAVVGLACLVVILLLPYWNPVGQVFFGTGLVWFNDVLYLGFTVVLLVTAYQMFTGQGAFFRPLLGGLVLLPAALLLSGLLRALWSLRSLTGIGPRRSLFALVNWLSMSWTVAMATLRGLVRKRAVFMRTPKENDEHQNAWTAIRAAKAETVLAVVLWGCAIGALAQGVYFVAALFAWQGVVYGSAPLMSWLSTRTVLTPELERRRRTELSRERMAALAGYYASGAVALAAVALVAAILIIGGQKPGQIPALPQAPTVAPSAPSPTVSPTRPATVSPTVSPTPSPSRTISPTPSPTRSPDASPTVQPTSSG